MTCPYLTDNEKSPGVLTVSNQKGSISGCLDNLSSASALVMRPWYHLQRERGGGGGK